ncbi:MAG: glycoside hydrolase family 88 protein [Williamsia sp.]|nr:glycoside hydrolase family 88 protein [Williamsia sp.]
MNIHFKDALIGTFVILSCCSCFTVAAQAPRNDVNTPLHLLQPDYPVPYGAPDTGSVKKVLDRVFAYLDGATPANLVNRKTGQPVADYSKPDSNVTVQAGDFRLMSYEWGVTYSGMLRTYEVTGDKKYVDYVKKRQEFLAAVTPYFKSLYTSYPQLSNPLRQIVDPHALDDAGAVGASMIKTTRAGISKNLRPLIDNYLNFVANKEFRFKDGTLARNRPLPNSLWLDDLYMGVPALAQMGSLTGEQKYFDDAARQILQFSARMFNPAKGVYMHGWVEGMSEHPQFHWARANGWAFLAMVELLDVLPENHASRNAIIQQLQAHAKGLVSYQSGSGLWHQLLDRPDSYLETSATAIYAYCIAHAINKGWLDRMAYGPAAILAWNAVTTKVNAKGQVEGTCVGTGMGFDPAFYYYRPVNVYAAHGYGPVLLAGAEIIYLLRNNTYKLNDSAVQYTK